MFWASTCVPCPSRRDGGFFCGISLLLDAASGAGIRRHDQRVRQRHRIDRRHGPSVVSPVFRIQRCRPTHAFRLPRALKSHFLQACNVRYAIADTEDRDALAEDKSRSRILKLKASGKTIAYEKGGLCPALILRNRLIVLPMRPSKKDVRNQLDSRTAFLEAVTPQPLPSSARILSQNSYTLPQILYYRGSLRRISGH